MITYIQYNQTNEGQNDHQTPSFNGSLTDNSNHTLDIEGEEDYVDFEGQSMISSMISPSLQNTVKISLYLSHLICFSEISLKICIFVFIWFFFSFYIRLSKKQSIFNGLRLFDL